MTKTKWLFVFTQKNKLLQNISIHVPRAFSAEKKVFVVIKVFRKAFKALIVLVLNFRRYL